VENTNLRYLCKVGTGVKELLEKVLLEAEVLDLKSNQTKRLKEL
jgi:hypothetical protein